MKQRAWKKVLLNRILSVRPRANVVYTSVLSLLKPTHGGLGLPPIPKKIGPIWQELKSK